MVCQSFAPGSRDIVRSWFRSSSEAKIGWTEFIVLSRRTREARSLADHGICRSRNSFHYPQVPFLGYSYFLNSSKSHFLGISRLHLDKALFSSLVPRDVSFARCLIHRCRSSRTYLSLSPSLHPFWVSLTSWAFALLHAISSPSTLSSAIIHQSVENRPEQHLVICHYVILQLYDTFSLYKQELTSPHKQFKTFLLTSIHISHLLPIYTIFISNAEKPLQTHPRHHTTSQLFFAPS